MLQIVKVSQTFKPLSLRFNLKIDFFFFPPTRSVLMLKITQSSTRRYTPPTLLSYLEVASGSSTTGEWIMKPGHIEWGHSEDFSQPELARVLCPSPLWCHVPRVTKASLYPSGIPTGWSTGSCCQRWKTPPMGWFKTSSTLSTGDPQSCLPPQYLKNVQLAAGHVNKSLSDGINFSVLSPADMALFQTVGGFTMKDAVSLHSSL